MRRIIHHVRKQPLKIRMHILHAVTVAFAALLFLLWVATLGKDIGKDNTVNNSNNEVNKPFSALKANFVDGYNSLNQ